MTCACELFPDGRIALCGAHAAEMRRHVAEERERCAKLADKAKADAEEMQKVCLSSGRPVLGWASRAVGAQELAADIRHGEETQQPASPRFHDGKGICGVWVAGFGECVAIPPCPAHPDGARA